MAWRLTGQAITWTNDDIIRWRICASSGLNLLNTDAFIPFFNLDSALHWRHNERDGVSNHQLHDCLLNRLFGRR